jgi:hypothetical protein
VRRAKLVSALALGTLLLGQQARASFVITPTFDPTITSDPNGSTIMATINSAIAIYEANFTDSITVHITFQEGGGLGGSNTSFGTIPYATYLAVLTADAKTSDDATALMHLPTALQFQTFFGTTNINVKTATERAIGIANSTNPDGTITLNTSIMNLSRTGPQDPSKYDLMAVASHEIDEVLGLGSALGTPFSANPFPEDLFRYDSSGSRSFTTSTSATAFFSIDGTTDLAEFNNQQSGADFGDWRSNPLPAGAQPKVQDAFATPGANPALSVELRALDVIGYDLITTPEPGTGVLLAAALVVLGGLSYARVSRKARLPREPEA